MVAERRPGPRRGARWAVPAGAVAAVAAVIAGMSAAGAQTAPRLPARGAAQLIASVAAARGPVPLTGTFTESASLGLPALPGGDGGPLGGLAALSGTHTYQLWVADARHLRIAEQTQLGESDLRVNGTRVWQWDSAAQTATRVLLPAAGDGRGHEHGDEHGQAVPRRAMPLTPQQAARRILAAVGPTTTVSVAPDVTVAGQPAYQLALAPKTSGSLIGQVRIAIDAARSLPLRVQVFARGAASPAFQAGYTALAFGRPAASNFSFTPPPGAAVRTRRVPAGPAVTPRRLPSGHPGHARPGWLSIAILPPVTAAPAAGLDAVREGHGKVVFYRRATLSPAPLPSSRALSVLLRAATPVHGSWGSGRLLRTSLLSVLFTSRGTYLGAVTPAVLYASAARAR